MAEADKGLPELGRELVDMTVAYAKQETLTPLKQLLPYLKFGIAGAAVGSIGLVFFLVGVLRLLQVEGGEHLDGRMSWLPYLVTLVVTGGIAVGALSRIKGDG